MNQSHPAAWGLTPFKRHYCFSLIFHQNVMTFASPLYDLLNLGCIPIRQQAGKMMLTIASCFPIKKIHVSKLY